MSVASAGSANSSEVDFSRTDNASPANAKMQVRKKTVVIHKDSKTMANTMQPGGRGRGMGGWFGGRGRGGPGMRMGGMGGMGGM